MIIKKKNKEQNVNQDNINKSSSERLNQAEKEQEIDIFNLDNIDFKQRNERRRGDRRRGFRRIDDRNLISRAKEEAESIKLSSAQEGYQKGLNDAQSDLEALRNSLKEFANAKQAIFDEIVPQIVSISVEIAKKIIKKEITESPEILNNNVYEILKSLSKDETKIMIKTNPSQVSFLKNEIPQTTENLGLDAKITIIADENISEGGCIISTTNGIVDATIETQLAIITEALKEV